MKETFKQLPLGEDILLALQKMGYQAPLEVQAKVIPHIMDKKDVIVQSQTGSGKTAAFAIPICESLDWNENEPQALILVPTRELAIQIQDEMQTIGTYKRLKIAALFGRQPYKKQLNELKQKVHAVVGTPGRVLDHLERGSLKVDQIRYIVLDEADEMLNMGFIEQVAQILKQMPTKRTTLLFSATMPERIVDLSKRYMHRPLSIEVQAEQLITDTIDHRLYRVEQHLKMDFLWKLLAKEQPDSVIIFGKTQENVKDICEMLVRKDCSVDKIHGGMLQEDRIRNMEDFRRGKYRILVATDVASRGIDIEELSHVINYDLPVEQEAYVHRIGRTGRVGKRGKAISLVSKYDQGMLEEIESLINQKIEELDAAEVENHVVTQNQIAFLQDHPLYKPEKSKTIQKDITKIYFNGGKQKKIRAKDLVGAIMEIPGMAVEDIGIIDIQEIASYVDILHGKGSLVIKALQDKTIKGKKLRIEKASKKK